MKYSVWEYVSQGRGGQRVFALKFPLIGKETWPEISKKITIALKISIFCRGEGGRRIRLQTNHTPRQCLFPNVVPNRHLQVCYTFNAMGSDERVIYAPGSSNGLKLRFDIQHELYTLSEYGAAGLKMRIFPYRALIGLCSGINMGRVWADFCEIYCLKKRQLNKIVVLSYEDLYHRCVNKGMALRGRIIC